MRVQTTFEKFAQATQGNIFAFCFVALRILLGVSFVIVVRHLNALEVSQLWNGHVWFDVIAVVLLMACSASFVLGLMVRPAAIVAFGVWASFAIAFLDFSQGVTQVAIAGIALLLGMFAAGGSGHAFGADGIVFRNIRRPGRVARFLFG